MSDKTEISLNPGTKVHYITETGKIFNGIIKEICPAKIVTEVFVVYHCGDNWINFRDYTGVRTKINELKPGWVKKLVFKAPVSGRGYLAQR